MSSKIRGLNSYLEALTIEAGLENTKDFIRNALDLLEWAIRETKDGRVIASVDEREKQYRQILLPALENVTVLDLVNHRVAGPKCVDPNSVTSERINR